eukprot:EG_transcript_51087
MNTVFLLECNVKFTLTHITLLGSTPAASARVPGEYALIHVCEVKITPEQKLAIMRRFLGTAFRPLEAVRPGFRFFLFLRLPATLSHFLFLRAFRCTWPGLPAASTP